MDIKINPGVPWMDEVTRLSGCCACCGAPFNPTREALCNDRVGSRSLIFIEGDALKNKNEWNLRDHTDPTLLGKVEDLHLFPRTNIIPAMRVFTKGLMRDVFGDEDSSGYDANLFLPGAVNAAANARYGAPIVPGSVYIIGESPRNLARPPGPPVVGALPLPRPASSVTKAAVAWESPPLILGFTPLHNILRACVRRIGGTLAMKPFLNLTIKGCESCNQIMTQESTSSHFLVRNEITQGEPLIPDEVIFRQEVYEQGGAGNYFYDGHYRKDPSDDNRDGPKGFFSYEACVAYFIHRCLPGRPVGAGGANYNQRLNLARAVRRLSVVISVALLTLMCLIFERYNGCEGGTVRRKKHAFRYRGVIEFYLSYIFWVMACNDNPEGEADGANQRRCNMALPMFHRYMFSELLQAVALSTPQFAGAYEFSDALFGPYAPDRPEEMLGHYCQCIAEFYTNHFRPMFSRHLSRLDPDRRLERGPAQDVGLFTRQVLAYNMLVSPDGLGVVMHFLGRATEGDFDTFLDCVGVSSVLAVWARLIQMCPARTRRLVNEFVDEMVKREYSHIMDFMRSDPSLPKIPPATAETVYLLCNTLYPPVEPENEEELALLRVAPKCSPHNAVQRLVMVGAVGRGEDVVG